MARKSTSMSKKSYTVPKKKKHRSTLTRVTLNTVMKIPTPKTTAIKTQCKKCVRKTNRQAMKIATSMSNKFNRISLTLNTNLSQTKRIVTEMLLRRLSPIV